MMRYFKEIWPYLISSVLIALAAFMLIDTAFQEQGNVREPDLVKFPEKDNRPLPYLTLEEQSLKHDSKPPAIQPSKPLNETPALPDASEESVEIKEPEPSPSKVTSNPDDSFFEIFEDGKLLPKLDPSSPSYMRFAKSHPENHDEKKLCVVLSELGLDPELLAFAHQELPKEVCFAILTSTNMPLEYLEKIRKEGREIVAQIPMESEAYPQEDAGYKLLLTSLKLEENQHRLAYHLSRFQGYIAVMPYQGLRFSSSEYAFNTFVNELARRRIGYLNPVQFPRPLNAKYYHKLNAFNFDAHLQDDLKTHDIEERFNAISMLLKSQTRVIINIAATYKNVKTLAAFLNQNKNNEGKPPLKPLSWAYQTFLATPLKSSDVENKD